MKLAFTNVTIKHSPENSVFAAHVTDAPEYSFVTIFQGRTGHNAAYIEELRLYHNSVKVTTLKGEWWSPRPPEEGIEQEVVSLIQDMSLIL